MSIYSVHLHGTISAAIEVEAESYDEAIEHAFNNAPQTSFAIADFDGVDEWILSGYYEDGVWFEGDSA